jgi:hypothetical protein
MDAAGITNVMYAGRIKTIRVVQLRKRSPKKKRSPIEAW